MTKVEITKRVFVYFCEKWYQKPMDYNIRSGDESVIVKFLNRVQEDGGSTGVSFLYDYTLYQFLRIYNSDHSKKSIFVSHIYGAAPYKAWKNKKVGWEHFGTTKFMASRQIVKWNAITAIMREAATEEDMFKISRMEHEARSRQNIYVCSHAVATSLWNPKDSYCKECPHKLQCKKLLKAKFPNIYKVRQEYEISEQVKWKNKNMWTS